MSKTKYHDGDRLGPDNILLIKRLGYSWNYCYDGLFECPHCPEHKQFVARISSVARGHKRSCGCLSGNKKDLTGKIYYNSVKVLEPTNKRASDGSVIWNCKCLWCNENFEVSSSRLENGSITSCGCSSGSFGERLIHRMLNQAGIPFQRQYSFSDFKKGNKKYRFDFFIDNKYLLEVDGEFHVQNNKQKDDQIKNSYCEQNKIPLIRISTKDLMNITLDDLLLEKTPFLCIGELNDS